MLTLEELSDPHIQNSEWVHPNYEDGNLTGIDPVVHFLFDDNDLGANPRLEIGRMLFNEAEVAAISPLVGLIGRLVDKLGDKDSAIYLRDREWPEVIKLAQSAWKLLAETGVAIWIEDRA